MTGPLARSWVEISLPTLDANLRALRSYLGPAVEIAAVVKADGYGHGAARIAHRLAAGGVSWFAVSCLEEGVALRQAGIAGEILVMGETLPFEREAFFSNRLTPVIHSLDGLKQWNDLASRLGRNLPCHVKLEPGLNRLGIREDPLVLARAIHSCPALHLDGLMTHFASATDFTTRQTEEQLDQFDHVRKALCAQGIAPRWMHVASTNGVAYGRRYGWDTMVRPGHLLYGYVSHARGEAPAQTVHVSPVLTWKARVVAVRDTPAGELVGYGGTLRAAKPMRLAVLGVGYADGIPHALSNRGKVLLRGKAAPLAGAVSMDMTTVDVTSIPGVEPGDAAILIGKDGRRSQNAQELAKAAKTISYNLLCGIGPRVKRIYLD